MAVETVHRYPVNQEKAPEGLAQFELLEERPRIGLVGISGEREAKIKGLGHLVVELAQESGVLGEEVISPSPIPEEELRSQISRLEELLKSERRQHAEEIKRLIEGYETEIAEMRQNFDQYKRETDERLEKLESPATAKPESVKEIFEKPVTEPAAINESLHPGDKVRVASSRGGVEGFDTVEEVIRDDDEKVVEIKIKNSGNGEVRSFPPGAVEIEPAVVERTGAPRVIVDEEERRGWWPQDRQLGAAALAGVGLLGLGAVLWEVVGERVFGIHDGGVTKREVTNIINQNTLPIKHQIAIDHAAEMKAIAADHTAEMKTIAQNHHTEMQAIHGVYKEVGRDHRAEMGAIHHLQREELKERITGHPLYFGFRYPWDWAANKVGIYRASPYLHELAAKAAKHSHRVQWLGSGRHQMLKIDGTFNARHVIGVLNRYR